MANRTGRKVSKNMDEAIIGTELDLLLFNDGKRLGFEFKCNNAPRMIKSILRPKNILPMNLQ